MVAHKVPVQKETGEGAVLGQPLHTPAAWTATDVLSRPTEWQYVLSPADRAEIVAATRHALATKKAVPDLCSADFPLPTLKPKLEQFRKNAVFGLGFQLLRRFPVDQLSPEEVVLAWYGLGTYWGNARSQNAKGHLVGHVKDLGLDPDGDSVRVYATHAAQPWHVDDADLVALLCLKKAKSGGCSGWASSVSVYNRLLETRPDLVEVLAEPFAHDRKGEENPGEAPFHLFPVFHVYQGHFCCWFNPRMTKEAQRFPGAPRLSPKHLEALQAVSDLADDPELHLEWQLEQGDIQLLHNWNQLHMRTEYEDHPGFENRRHLLRLWLTHPEDARPLDPTYFGHSPAGARLGIYKQGAAPNAPIDGE